MSSYKTFFDNMIKAYLTPGAARPEQNTLIEVPDKLLKMLYEKVKVPSDRASSMEERDLEIIILEAVVSKLKKGKRNNE